MNVYLHSKCDAKDTYTLTLAVVADSGTVTLRNERLVSGGDMQTVLMQKYLWGIRALTGICQYEKVVVLDAVYVIVNQKLMYQWLSKGDFPRRFYLESAELLELIEMCPVQLEFIYSRDNVIPAILKTMSKAKVVGTPARELFAEVKDCVTNSLK